MSNSIINYFGTPMEHDYSLLIGNIKRRRYDESLSAPMLSDAFYHSGYSECLLYALEAMVEVDVTYAYKVYEKSREIHDILIDPLKSKGHNVDYRYQGELKVGSNIFLYGNLEIIIITKNISNKPHKDLQSLTSDLIDILQRESSFKSIDYSDKIRIRITTQNPTYEIHILPSLWVDTAEYIETKNEIYRGITEFDFNNKKVRKYLPFLNISRINFRNKYTKGIFNALSRLLKIIKSDHSHNKINLTNAEIDAILYSISKDELLVPQDKVLSLLPKITTLLNKLSTDAEYLSHLTSPSQKDRVFSGKPEKQLEVRKLSDALNVLIKDIKEDLDNDGKSLDSEIPYLELG